jgi:cytosine/uracil/thiamine/allantoin permease
MRNLKSAFGAALAALYALAFVAAYVDYLRKAGQWFADVWLVLAALPFTMTMRALAGSYDFSGDETARVIAAAAFCCVLAYLAGAIVEALLRALFRLATGRRR